jgi:hypothetical protein
VALAVFGRLLMGWLCDRIGPRKSFLKGFVELPVELDYAGLLAAAGRAALGNGVGGVLSGAGKLLLPAGDLEFPFEFPVTLSWK